MASLPPRVWNKFTSQVVNTTDQNKIGSARWNEDLNVFLGTVCDALSKLNVSADKVAFFTSASSADLTALTIFARSLLAASGAADVRTLLSALDRSGDTMAGDLGMATHRITGLGAPVDFADAATKAYVDAVAVAASGSLVFKGAWDASAGTFPGGGIAQTGHFYRVSVGGIVDGVAFTAGDNLYAIADNASTTTYSGHWLKIEGGITLSEVQAAVGFTFGSLASLSSITTSLISDASVDGRTLLTAADYAAMRALLGLGSGALETGDVVLTINPAAPSGWVMCDDGTIGSPTSGATTRAHADTEALYTLIWNNVADSHAPVTGGRGVNAVADFAANKPIALTKVLGRALAVAGSGSGLTSRALGLALGAETHSLLGAENGPHTHPLQTAPDTANGNGYITNRGTTPTGAVTATGSAGSGAGHNNIQPTSFLHARIKL